MIKIGIDKVKIFAVAVTVNRELDFRSEYFFRSRFINTNLVTSLVLNPIRCAIMLCHFGQTRNCSIAIHFILRGSAETSIAARDYVATPERFGQNEESISNQLEGSLVLFPKV